MFEKLGHRAAQLAASVTSRVDNLIEEHRKVLAHNKELKKELLVMQREYQGLLSHPEIRYILNKAETEKSEYITTFLASYDKTTSVK